MLDNKIHFFNSSTILFMKSVYEVVFIARCMSLYMTMVESFCLWFFSFGAFFSFLVLYNRDNTQSQ